MPAGANPDLPALGRTLVALQIVMGLSAAAMGWWLFRLARAGRRAAQWPPPGTRMLRWREPATGDRARRAAAAITVAAAVMGVAGVCLVYLAFRFARLFRVW